MSSDTGEGDFILDWHTVKCPCVGKSGKPDEGCPMCGGDGKAVVLDGIREKDDARKV